MSRKGKTYEEIYGDERAQTIRKTLRECHLHQRPWNKDKKFGPISIEQKNRQSLVMKGKIQRGEFTPYQSKGITDVQILGLWSRGFTASEISKNVGSSVQNILNRLRKQGVSGTDIQQRGRWARSRKMTKIRKKWNPVWLPEVRKKIAKSVKNLYDTDPEYRAKNPFLNFSPAERERHARLGYMASNRRPTSLERMLLNIINKYDLPYRYVGDGALWINNMNPDFIHRQKNIIIEVLGNHWHTKSEVKKRGQKFIECGFKLIEIWENELQNLPDIAITARLTV